MKLPIYLDYMATTPVDPRVKAKMLCYLDNTDNFGNPASLHFYGHQAREAVEEARLHLASLIHADSKEIIWTSGATESNNLALKGAAYFYKRKGKHIVTLQTEHRAVLDVCAYLETEGFEVTYLKPEKNGLLDLAKLKEALRPDTILVSVMQVNNEIGVIQDIAAIGELLKDKGIIFHVDAAQSLGRLPIDVSKLNVQLMSFSAHKVYGPKGIGALYVRGNPRIHLVPQIHGGGQEHGLRSGTLAVSNIVGFGEACRILKIEMAEENKCILALRNKLWQGISGRDANNRVCTLNGDFDARVAANLNISFGPKINGELLFSAISGDLAVSAGSACTVAKTTPSHVLKAIGLNNSSIQSSIRLSLGRFTTKEEILHAIEVIRKAVYLIANPAYLL